MNPLKEVKIYVETPTIYDYLMRKISYDTWAKYIFNIVKSYVSKDADVLELAGGNCKFANYFSKYFPKIIVTDISKNMLLRDTKNQLLKCCCCMTAIPFKKKFDLIYSNFDSINYLMSKRKLLNTFSSVKELLTSDGIFTFDVSLEKNSFIHTKHPLRKGSFDGIQFSQLSEYNQKSRIHKNTFVLEKNDKTFKEIHRQKIFTFETYFEMLDKAGLYVKHCYNAFSFKNGTSESERVQFITKKVNRNVIV